MTRKQTIGMVALAGLFMAASYQPSRADVVTGATEQGESATEQVGSTTEMADSSAAKKHGAEGKLSSTKKHKRMTKIYDFKALTTKGKELDFAQFQGKVLLIVNTASKCGFTPQFEGLEKLNQEYKDKGLVVIGFPCNQFAGQDPGTDGEISEFCQVNYGVTFQIMKKIDVNGPEAHPIFTYLKSQAGFAGFNPAHPIAKVLDQMLSKADPDYAKNPDIKWNFTKFLISKDGTKVQRFEPTATPEEMAACIEALL